MSDDFISTISQKKHSNSSAENIFFPDIPEPPPGFDPEAEVLYKTSLPAPTQAGKNNKKNTLVPRARVFIVGSEGNLEFEEILLMGVEGKAVLGRKEISDLRGSPHYKVYMEWLEVIPKK